MNNLMSNFSGLAMSRMEMKKVTGGCMAMNSNGTVMGPFSSGTRASIAAGAGGHWCCASCGSVNW